MQGGSLVIRATKNGAKFALERLSLADLGGASIEAQGETSPSGRWTIVKLDARRLGDFATLLARAAPGAPARWFLQHADELGSAKATFEARRDGPALAGAFPLDFLKADGEIADARFALTLNRAPAPVDAISVKGALDAPDAGALLRKLGAKLSPGTAGRAELTVNGSGKWESGFDGAARLDIAGASLNWSGALRPEATGDAPWISGPLTLKSADVFPALSALGMAVTGTGVTAPADLSADFAASAKQAHVDKLMGTLAGSRASGEISWMRPREAATLAELVAMAQSTAVDANAAGPSQPSITGELAFDHASPGALLSLVLGRAGPTRPGALWSPSPFGPALLSPPAADIGLKIDALDLGFGVGRSMTSRLQIDRDQLALQDVAMTLNGGQAGGRVTLRRDKAQTTANGALTMTGVGVERGGARGRIDAALDFAGAGDSAAALVGGLAGVGRLKVIDAKWARLDPDALGRVMEKIEQAAGPPPDEKRLESQIGAELDRGPLALENVGGALDMSSGSLRFGPLATSVRDGSASLAGAFDLADLSLSLEAKLVDKKVGTFWSGPPPTVEVAVRGDAPQRKIDATALVAGLAAESLARETDRIANFEADLRERAAFNRKLKAERFLARRDEEIAEFEAEQERRRLMSYYLGPYTTWAASHRDAQPSARSEARSGKEAAKDPTSNGLY